MIRTVIFDIGNVLAGFDWYSFFRKQGFSEEMCARLGRATVQSDDWKEYDNDPEIAGEIRQALDDFHGLVTPYEYAVDWVKELKAKGYQVLVLSNFSDKALKECWHALDFLPYTDGGILSFQDKLIKPMPEIYRLILDRYRLEPDECVFMDDTRANVEGAKAAGIHAFVFENIAQAKEELEKLGVK